MRHTPGPHDKVETDAADAVVRVYVTDFGYTRPADRPWPGVLDGGFRQAGGTVSRPEPAPLPYPTVTG